MRHSQELEIVRVAIVTGSTITSSLGMRGSYQSFSLKGDDYELYDICCVFHKITIK